jgi:hypothetical protein
MERLDQGHLHPLLYYRAPETDTSRQGSNPGLRGERGEHSSKDLLQQLIRNLNHTIYGSQRFIIDET